MERRTYRGPVTAQGLADALVARFNAGQLMAQASGPDDQRIVQIAAREGNWGERSRAALTISIIQQDDAVEVSIGEHQWLGPAADILQAGVMPERSEIRTRAASCFNGASRGARPSAQATTTR